MSSRKSCSDLPEGLSKALAERSNSLRIENSKHEQSLFQRVFRTKQKIEEGPIIIEEIVDPDNEWEKFRKTTLTELNPRLLYDITFLQGNTCNALNIRAEIIEKVESITRSRSRGVGYI